MISSSVFIFLILITSPIVSNNNIDNPPIEIIRNDVTEKYITESLINEIPPSFIPENPINLPEDITFAALDINKQTDSVKVITLSSALKRNEESLEEYADRNITEGRNNSPFFTGGYLEDISNSGINMLFTEYAFSDSEVTFMGLYIYSNGSDTAHTLLSSFPSNIPIKEQEEIKELLRTFLR